MSQPAITVKGLSKAYRIGLKEEIPDTLVGAATSWLKAPVRNFQNLRKLNTFSANGEDQPDIVWALRDVSFEVAEGEVLGIIGRNGAGKSTLLKILSRITEPTRGRAIIRGRVSSLLEVGTGFHPELSGRENIYMNGTILGMRKKEIDQKLDQIVDFSGVEKFLDTPIKRYSSGMKVRLAFSVAAHLEPEILIIDEVLAVGDAEFQKKCLGKMHDVASQGRTVLFVSHNMDAVQRLCESAFLLDRGEISTRGAAETVISHYYRSNEATRSAGGIAALTRSKSNVTHPIFTGFKVNGQVANEFVIPCGSPLNCELSLQHVSEFDRLVCSLIISTESGQRVLMLNSLYHSGIEFKGDDLITLNCHLAAMTLVPGDYRIDLSIGERDTSLLELVENVATLHIVFSDYLGTGKLPNHRQGVLVVPAKWSLSD